jgi:hypothetical protein
VSKTKITLRGAAARGFLKGLVEDKTLSKSIRKGALKHLKKGKR